MTREPGGAPGEDDDPLLDTVVAGRYRLLEKIGEGAAGAVYRGVHEALRKTVAVKLLGRAARADREVVTRFEREAVAAANLKHPNIAEATDFGQMADGTLFLVMEYVQGSSLRAILTRDGRLPPARVLHLIRQVGSAVVFAHARDVVHRDLKPENVVVYDQDDARDLVKVIDFGIARMRSSFGGGPSGLTQVGSVMGTVEYMAPEQAMAQSVDERADQYALGVIAFELFTGRPPYVADDVAQLIYMHVGAPIPRATELAPELPAAVDDVITRMMGKLPDERFPTLSEAITALGNAVERPAPAALVPAAPPAAFTPPAVYAPAAVPRPLAASPLVTASGTIVVPVLPPRAPLVPRPPGGAARKQGDMLIVLAAAVVSVIGLVVILVIALRSGSTSTSADPSASATATATATGTGAQLSAPAGAQPSPPGDVPLLLAPTSHDNARPRPRRGRH